MIIKKIQLNCEGYIHCHSRFYSSFNVIPDNQLFTFHNGTNKFIGEIDSEGWSVSYLLSMYDNRPKDFVLDEPNVLVNDCQVPLKELSRYTCYMDKSYPLFSSRLSVRKLITNGLKKSKSTLSVENIKELFQLDDQRFERPISQTGNESIRAMAAVGVSYGKQVFCFPWLSKNRFEYYHNNIIYAIETLERLEKTIILPVGYDIG